MKIKIGKKGLTNPGKEIQKLNEDSRPSNLNFGLI